jgi:hypothetical protein
VLLAARSKLLAFVRSVLLEDEVRDGRRCRTHFDTFARRVRRSSDCRVRFRFGVQHCHDRRDGRGRATKTPALLGSAAAGGVLSTVTTVGRVFAILAAVSIPVLQDRAMRDRFPAAAVSVPADALMALEIDDLIATMSGCRTRGGDRADAPGVAATVRGR